MTTERIIDIQRRVGTFLDGRWGTQSIAATKEYLLSLMPSPNPWPKSDQASLRAFYGEPGDVSQLTAIDVEGLGVIFQNEPVTSVRVHSKCAESLLEILRELQTVRPDMLAKYDGVFEPRPVRGSSVWSLHAWGAAIDLDARHNGERVPWPIDATMPLEVMEVFARHGWLCAGAAWGRDAMHFQATR